jgi:UDP-hydrolysing UDP-N-acetyl-D-glucosamine 2-epimerase
MRKVLVFVGSRANYGRLRSVCKAIQEHEALELQLILGASFYNADVEFPVDSRIQCLINSDDHESMALTTGILLTKVSAELARLKPDIVLVHGDRYEVLAVAQAAAYMNISLAHTEGGEVTGCIDDKVRNCITALADIHFPVTEKSRTRIDDLSNFVYVVGSTALDSIKCIRDTGRLDILEQPETYALFVYHPETTHHEDMNILLNAMRIAGISNVIAISPNVDAGSRKILKKLHKLNFMFLKDLPYDVYARYMFNSSLCIGNSSSFIKEGSFLGAPAVIVGDRQKGREIDDNCVCVPMDISEIVDAIDLQWGKQYNPSNCFGDGTAAQKICKVLAEVEL